MLETASLPAAAEPKPEEDDMPPAACNVVSLFLSPQDASHLKNMTIDSIIASCLAGDMADLFAPQLAAAINIQSWISPEKRTDFAHIPNDPYYLQNYARWRAFLVLEAQAMLTVCNQLSGFEFRSLLLARGDQILNELQFTALREIRINVFRDLAKKVLIPQDLVESLLAIYAGASTEVGPSSFLPSETGLGFIVRDRGGAAEEDLGIISFECVTNTREPDAMVKLLTLKNLFSRQLPKMPREYITRLTFDRQHYSFCLLKKGKVIGGVCFRPFFARKFAEIVFLAITSSEQVKGYGTRLMNHLKEFVRHRGIEYFLTYADNFALGYFRKQGFSQRISMAKDRWTGFIKDYDGGTLMECYVSPSVNYLHLGDIFCKQKTRVHRALRLLRTPSLYSGAALWSSVSQKPDLPPETDMYARHMVDPKSIVGFKEAGWTEELSQQRKKEPLPLNDQILKIVDLMTRNESSWPFRKPVSRQEAPDYHEHIKQPMDISTIRKNAKAKLYQTKAEFGAHLKLMFDNCRYYNMQSSIYYKLADELEAAIWPKFEALEET